MKNFKLINYFLIAASGLVFMQCTNDYQAIPGKDGVDGTNGIDGVNGADGVGVQECIDCHSSSHRDVIKGQYLLSNHYGPDGNGADGSWARGTSGSCARCHNNQGFIDFTSGLFVDSNGNQSADPDGYAVSHPINCTGCHDPEEGHRSFDFANDGNDYALRTLGPVDLIIKPGTTMDLKNESDLLGRSNTCVTCHQSRTAAPTVADAVNGKFMITSSHWGPHHGPQSSLLEGINGAEIAGSEGYPTGYFPHRSEASCIKCHMSEGSTADNGGHTFNPTRTACASCHDDADFPDANSFDREGFQTETLDRLETLAGLLANVVGQDIARDSNGDYQPVYEADGVTPVTHVGIVVDGHPVLGLYDFLDAQAAWNYIYVEEDRSEGVHNPAYIDALLPNSIEALQN